MRESNLDWFLEYAKKKIGNGVATFFLREPWLSIYRFATLFLILFPMRRSQRVILPESNLGAVFMWCLKANWQDFEPTKVLIIKENYQR